MFVKDDYQNLEDPDEPFHTEIHPKITWDHIQNLDKFFSNVYYFHQQHGFFVTFIEFILQVLKFFFIIWIMSVFSDIFFTKFQIVQNGTINYHCFYNPIILRSDNGFTTLLVVVSLLLLILFILNSVPKLHQFYSISKFYRDALKIKDSAIPDTTWSEVLRALIEVQKELQLSVHKSQLNELDIYHRILRRQNYLIAMMVKEIFPTEISIPIFGGVVIVTKYYLDTIKYMLFKFPYKAPFGDHWQLRPEYKDLGCRKRLISQLTAISVSIGICQLLVSPFCFMYLLVTKACTHGHSLKVSPANFISREISPLGRLFLAHYNELPHEFIARTAPAHAAASAYLDSFTPKPAIALARLIRFLAGGVILVGFAISFVEPSFLLVPHVVTMATAATLLYAGALKVLPEGFDAVCPRRLLDGLLRRLHYLPASWREAAHTRRVASEVAALFQPRVVTVAKELLSCFSSPLVFLLLLPQFAPKIVDFLRNYTCDMLGVGDICSYARMDVSMATAADATTKVELSLVNFHGNNPRCSLGPAGDRYIDELRQNIASNTIATVANAVSMTTVSNTPARLRNATGLAGPPPSLCALDNYFPEHDIAPLGLSQDASIVCGHYRSVYIDPSVASGVSVPLLIGLQEHQRRVARERPISEEDADQESSMTSPFPPSYP